MEILGLGSDALRKIPSTMILKSTFEPCNARSVVTASPALSRFASLALGELYKLAALDAISRFTTGRSLVDLPSLERSVEGMDLDPREAI